MALWRLFAKGKKLCDLPTWANQNAFLIINIGVVEEVTSKIELLGTMGVIQMQQMHINNKSEA